MTQFHPEGILIDTQENKDYLRNSDTLLDAMHNKKILEARVTVCDNEHNLWVDLGCMKGMIPKFEGSVGLDDGSVRDIALISRVNKPVCFVVTDITYNESGEQYAVLSRRIPQQLCQNKYINLLKR